MRSVAIWFRSTLFFLATKCVGLFKISFMLGSYAAFFSASNCVTPLSGAFFGIGGSTIVFGLSALLRFVLYGGMFPFSYLVHMVPGLCASYYWASRSWLIRLLVPIVCMMLFMLHPVGSAAWVYALYWLIPVALYLFDTKNLFAQALGSTFIAHAVGSVIWLYTVPMSVAAWYALIPIVVIERFCFAFGMVVLHKLISWMMSRKWMFYKKVSMSPV